jgi:cellulose synthase/poly-beta-1,6-N-acetylglucosamine synthase-like glycosyltransferase
MPTDFLVPNLVVLGALTLISACSPKRGNLARAIFVAIAAALRYQWWRWTDTIPAAWWTSRQGLYAFGCFAFEVVVLFDALIGMVVLSRSVDRGAEADAHEAALRALPVDALPSVDVLIPTYDEGQDVLERTIVAAMALDYPNFTVWVCDDKRRPWVAALAAAKGAEYLTRPDNAHAKAGNINAALKRISGDLVMVLDADFAVRRHALWRLVGFFRDPTIACVQTPQYFFNKDPVQTNLRLFDRVADDQRLFFDVIMPARDAWGAAFCCGTGFVMRRSALEAIGGVPTGSICEDMLTSVELKRRGLETVYLKEELCIGLAPESVKAFFVQRMRWARGNIQMLFLKNGVFGRGLPLFYRLMFLPNYWAVQLPARIAYVVIPLVFLLTGLAPILVPDPWQLAGHLLPAIIGSLGLICWVGRAGYVPILSDAAGLFMAIRVAPATLRSLLRPFGTPFRVTPKGVAARGQAADRAVMLTCLSLLALTLAAVIVNANPAWRVIDDRNGLTLGAFWAIWNAVVIGLAALIARDKPRRRSDERFALGSAARWRPSGAEAWRIGLVEDASLGGIRLGLAEPCALCRGDRVALGLPRVGDVTARIVRVDENSLGLAFEDAPEDTHDRLIRVLFTEQHPVHRATPAATLPLFGTLAARLFGADPA